jgi:hypothetical protein
VAGKTGLVDHVSTMAMSDAWDGVMSMTLNLSPTESGIIATNPDVDSVSGPATILSMQIIVDPNSEIEKAFVLLKPDDVWFAAHTFQAPFFLKQGQSLAGRPGETHRGVLYTAHRD